MRKTLLFTMGVMTLVGISATGCVRHDRYDTAKTATHSLQEQLVSTQSERDTAINALSARDRIFLDDIEMMIKRGDFKNFALRHIHFTGQRRQMTGAQMAKFILKRM